jgi:SAM-dependent methyltransferase
VDNLGAITEDGCPVEVYLRLPTAGEPEVVHAQLPPGGSVLDLGCGVGRIADPLAALGHDLVGVDNSPEMLARVSLARTVHADIATVRLAQRFDLVLAASHLLNQPDREDRRRLYDTVAWHLSENGTALFEWHPPDWFDALEPGISPEGRIGPVRTRLRVDTIANGLLTAAVTYADEGRQWTQPFTARRLTPDQVDAELAEVGLTLAEPPAPRWLRAVAAH